MISNVCRNKLLLSSALAGSLVFGAGAAQAADPTYQFNIPAESLSQALTDFSQASSQQIIYSEDLVRGRQTHGLHGSYSAVQALDELLAGTGLKAETSAAGVLMVRSKNVQAASNSEEAGPTSDIETVTVTGTHIRGGEPASNLVTIDQAAIQSSGYTNVGDVLRSVPQNFGGGNNPSLLTQAAPNQNTSPSGGSAPNLFGLGSASTLTLVDGRRLPEDTGGSVDITPIPIEAIDRIEVVPDGASATYGSDAVAGVVNIILKKDFDGAETTATTGVSTDGGGFDQGVSQMLGKTWNSGGGLLDYSYDNQDAVSASQRNFSQTAPRPFTLLPSSVRNSFFGTIHQDLDSAVSLFAEGYYATRKVFYETTYPVPLFTGASTTSVDQYYATAGANIALGNDWQSTLYASASRQSTRQDSIISGLTPTPLNILQPIHGSSETVEANANGPLIELPTGAVQSALGAGVRQESYVFEGSSSGKRSVSYVFGELLIPLVAPSATPGLNRLDLNVSGRFEHYTDFGNSAVPKVGLIYQPTSEVTLRATWGKSFHAPLLDDTTAPETVALNEVPDPLSPTGTSNALVRLIGNPDLRPETANTIGLNADYTPHWLDGLKLTGSYFNINYHNVIESLGSYELALTNPAYASLVTRNPSAALQQQILAGAGLFQNFTPDPYDPSTVASIIDARPNNAAFQKASGFELQADYSTATTVGDLHTYLNGTYLDLTQRLTAASPLVTLSGTVFEPAHIRARAGATLSTGPWSFTGTLNFTGPETNVYLPNNPSVSSWFTVDGQVAYQDQTGSLGGLRLALSVQNLFDTNPPNVIFDQQYPGLHYDPTNASPIGRFVSLRVSKEF